MHVNTTATGAKRKAGKTRIISQAAIQPRKQLASGPTHDHIPMCLAAHVERQYGALHKSYLNLYAAILDYKSATDQTNQPLRGYM